jgi:hypothetical protein
MSGYVTTSPMLEAPSNTLYQLSWSRISRPKPS